MINAEKLVDFLSIKKITANQYLLCHLLYHREYDVMKRLVENEELRFTQEEVNDLIQKGYLEQLFDDNSQFSYMVTDKFAKHIFVEEDEAGEELWAAYPKMLYIDGVAQSTRTCDKDDVLAVYHKRIKASREKHKYVMMMLEKYKGLVESGEMNSMGIEKWIKGENWDVVGSIIDYHLDDYKSDLI